MFRKGAGRVDLVGIGESYRARPRGIQVETPLGGRKRPPILATPGHRERACGTGRDGRPFLLGRHCAPGADFFERAQTTDTHAQLFIDRADTDAGRCDGIVRGGRFSHMSMT